MKTKFWPLSSLILLYLCVTVVRQPRKWGLSISVAVSYFCVQDQIKPFLCFQNPQRVLQGPNKERFHGFSLWRCGGWLVPEARELRWLNECVNVGSVMQRGTTKPFFSSSLIHCWGRPMWAWGSFTTWAAHFLIYSWLNSSNECGWHPETQHRRIKSWLKVNQIF